MKKLKRILTMLLSVLILGTSLVGCGGGGDDLNEETDSSKTQLIVNVYNGGVGIEWLKKNRTEFEKLFKDYKGKDGKVGVQIEIKPHLDDGETLFVELGRTSDDVFFTDKSRYSDMISEGYVLDITDVVTGENSYDDGKTIESMLNEQQKGYYKVNGKYYGLPHYESFGGITYNVNIFNTYSLFFAKGGAKSEFSAYTQSHNATPATGAFSGYKYTDLSGAKSAGPDGVYDTSDDGLPATYEEFFVLCDKMVTVSVTPFIWSGAYGKAYMNYLLKALFADYEGAEQLQLAYDFEGTAKHLVDSISANGTVNFKPETAITVDNGYEMFKTAGRYYAMSFLEKILSKPAYYSDKINNAHSHLDAQADFAESEFYGKPIAMLVEGCYWENEAEQNGTFDDLARYGVSKEDLKYSYMALPKVSEAQIGETVTICEQQNNITFLSANIPEDKIALAKEFLKYCYTESALGEFTATTGMTRGLNYSLEGVQENLSTYYKSMVELKKNSNVCYLISDSSVYLKNQVYFNNASFSTTNYEYILDGMQKYGQSAVSLFNSLSSQREDQWSSLNK